MFGVVGVVVFVQYNVTSRLGKAKLPTHVNLSSEKLSKDSIVLLEQIRTIDKCRLVEYIGKATPEEMEFIEKALLVSVGINKRNDYEV